MTPEEAINLPFINRDQLDFKHGTTFGIEVLSVASVAATFSIVGATRQGPFTLRIDSDSTGMQKLSRFTLPDIPIWLSIYGSATGLVKNSLYVSVALRINGNTLNQLMAGYVYSMLPITWPAITVQDFLPAEIGKITAHTSSVPAAGAEIAYGPSQHATWHIRALSFTLTTSAAVANRRVHFKIANAAGGDLEVISSVDHAASLARKYSLMPLGGNGALSDDNDIIIPIPPDIWVQTSGSFATITTNIQAGDQFTALNVWSEDFILGP
jgi:hypothetical protein